MIDIYQYKPPKHKYVAINRFQNKTFKKKYDLKIINNFFKQFPEEKRGRKRFKEKEILNVKTLIYEEILRKADKINAECIGSIKEKVSKQTIMITVSFFKKK